MGSDMMLGLFSVEISEGLIGIDSKLAPSEYTEGFKNLE